MASTQPSKGVYVETDESFTAVRVVEGSVPERGYILIAPGVIPTPDDEKRVKDTRDLIAGRTTASTDDADAAAEPTPVKAPARSRS
jgi:hypothetical protein